MAYSGHRRQGKSTVGKKLEEEFDAVYHISVGHLLRSASSGPSVNQHKHAARMRIAMQDGLPVR